MKFRVKDEEWILFFEYLTKLPQFNFDGVSFTVQREIDMKCKECGKKIGYLESSRYNKLCADCRVLVSKAGFES